jgi:hypothetical protein
MAASSNSLGSHDFQFGQDIFLEIHLFFLLEHIQKCLVFIKCCFVTFLVFAVIGSLLLNGIIGQMHELVITFLVIELLA